jgi:hypothetical protein
MSNIFTNGSFEAWTDANTPTGWTDTITAGAGETSTIRAGVGMDEIEGISKSYDGGMQAPSLQDPTTKQWTGYGSFRAGTLPSGISADLMVDELGTKVTLHQHLTLKASTRYKLSFWYRMGYDLNELSVEEQTLTAHAPRFTLVEDGNGHSLQSDGTWAANQNAVVALPSPKTYWQKCVVFFTTPATHTAYTFTFDSNNMAGTEYVAYSVGPPEVAQVVGYEHCYIDYCKLEECDADTDLPLEAA